MTLCYLAVPIADRRWNRIRGRREPDRILHMIEPGQKSPSLPDGKILLTTLRCQCTANRDHPFPCAAKTPAGQSMNVVLDTGARIGGIDKPG